MNNPTELKRRTITKTLIWRIIGIIWTWVGAYFIILVVPEKYSNAAIIATLIVVYHHSTRMIMYYFYERIWSNIIWGRSSESNLKLSTRSKILWTVGTLIIIALVFFLLLYVSPLISNPE